jgi:hypothetical protein
VGTFASVPYEICYGGKSFKTLQALDNCIHEEHRGVGIQSKMYSLLISLASRESYCFVFGFPGGKGLELGLGRLGYQIICKLENWLLSLDKMDRKFISFIDFREISVYDMLLQLPLSSREKKLHVPKTFDYLRWRYASKNDATFRIFASFKDNTLQSYIVYGYKNSCPDLLRIYEIEYVNEISALETFQNSLIKLKDEGVRNIVSYVKKNGNEESFMKLSGFTYCPDRPITVVVGKVWPNEIPEDVMFDQENWYISLGDSDL